MREALLKHLDEMEWAYSIATRAEAIRKGAEATRELDDVARDLGFDPGELHADARAETDA